MPLPVIYEEAKKATSCLEWHRHCNAECCRGFRVKWETGKRAYKGMRVAVPMSEVDADLKWYLELHGASVVNNVVLFRLGDFTLRGGYLFVFRKCDYLSDDLTCKGHLTSKPLICQGTTAESVAAGEFATPNCLFKYKAELAKQ